GARGRGWLGAGVVGRGVAVGEADDLFRDGYPLAGGRPAGVGHDVVDPRRPHGAGKTEPLDLRGRRAGGEDRTAGAGGPAGDVDHDVAAIFSDATRRVRKRERADGHEFLDRALDAAAQLARIGRRIVVADDLDTRAVV